MLQWYPGHMAKTEYLIKNNLKIVDIVYEVLDARIPRSSKNPMIDRIISSKKRIVLLNKADLADDSISKKWISYYDKNNTKCIAINSLKYSCIQDIYSATKECLNEKILRKKQRGVIPRIRVMILGIPNVGKSTLINSFSKSKSAKTGDKPGITRSKQWIKTKQFDLLDTPGILWPKFEDETVGVMLGITGGIKDDMLNFEDITIKLLSILRKYYLKVLTKRYKIENTNVDENLLLKNIGLNRGCLLPGNVVDLNRAAKILIEDFRSGRLGKISLERPN